MFYNLPVPVLHNLRVTLQMIKWEHSVFALPFALCGAMLAASGLPTAHQLVWIVIAMVAARSAAMAFNRLADAAIDSANPRTRTRALPAGQLSPAFVATFVIVSCAIFILAAAQLNRLTLWLSPVALAVLLLYSYTKRFTRWSHLVLGFALGIAPAFHVIMLLLLIALIPAFALGKLALAGVIAAMLLLLYEHSLVKPDDLSKLNAAFFTMNGVISVVFALFVAADILLRK